jgi:hypothetical protein
MCAIYEVDAERIPCPTGATVEVTKVDSDYWTAYYGTALVYLLNASKCCM